MKQELFSQSPKPQKQHTILYRIEEAFHAVQYDTLYAASAYATVGGVRQIVEAAAKYTKIEAYNWILGLDHYITHPKALELCRDLPGSQLRVPSSGRTGNSIFHPKVILLSSSQKPEQSLLIVGSANLTAAALTRNAEAIAILRAETSEEATEFFAFWDNIWRLGTSPTNAKLQNYGSKYDNAKQARQELELLIHNTEVEEDPADAAELDASQASVCWIEVGKIVHGRELEFVAAQAPFFGLTPENRTGTSHAFKLSNGNIINLRLIYRSINAMWRLELDRQVPEVAKGLKVGMERSPFVAVVRRLRGSRFSLRFIRADSTEYIDLRAKALAVGTLGKTSARSYGWY